MEEDCRRRILAAASELGSGCKTSYRQSKVEQLCFCHMCQWAWTGLKKDYAVLKEKQVDTYLALFQGCCKTPNFKGIFIWARRRWAVMSMYLDCSNWLCGCKGMQVPHLTETTLNVFHMDFHTVLEGTVTDTTQTNHSLFITTWHSQLWKIL